MNDNQTFAVVIPARYKSSRFPGKPLVDICGKPMIQHVWERCCEAVGKAKVYVATDDSRIESVVNSFGGEVILTSSDCLTGTDRLAEVNEKLDLDFLINVQGDEPMIDPQNILKVIEVYKKTGRIVNAMSRITTEQEFCSFTVPKVITSTTGRLMYMSRSCIPITKDGEFRLAYKQVCVYAFSREHLKFFSRKKIKSPIEAIEDIEILRFLEADYHIDMVEVDSGSLAVDIPSDVEKIEMAMTDSS